MKVGPFPELDTKQLVVLSPVDRRDLADGFVWLTVEITPNIQRHYRAVLELLSWLVPGEIEQARNSAKNVHE